MTRLSRRIISHLYATALPYRDYILPRVRKAAVVAMFDLVDAISKYSDQQCSSPLDHSRDHALFGTLDYVKNLSSVGSGSVGSNKAEFYPILIEIANWAMTKYAIELDEECRCFQKYILQIAAEIIEKEDQITH